MNFNPPPSQPSEAEEKSDVPEQTAPRSDNVTTVEDHYSALARMVSEISQDHARLRSFVYEFARVNLRRDLYPQFIDGDWPEIERQIRGLEVAIHQIETDFQQKALPGADRAALSHRPQEPSANRMSATLSVAQRTTTFGAEAIRTQSLFVRLPAFRASMLPAVPDPNGLLANAVLANQLRSKFWRNVQIIMAAGIGLAIFAAIGTPAVFYRLSADWLQAPRVTATNAKEQPPQVAVAAATVKPSENSPRAVDDIPIPTEYGAYVVSDGRLVELQQLPIRVPDPRVAISAEISVPSRTHLPSGKLRFVVFRRDLINSAPDQVPVRVLAQVMRALTFDAGGHPKTTDIQQSWAIRNNAYQMRVAPLGNNPEMVVISPDPADFVFSPGRYAMVLKSVGYDFTVDGRVTDLAHCLERTDALNAPIYSQCRKL